jgi:TctA family transporter
VEFESIAPQPLKGIAEAPLYRDVGKNMKIPDKTLFPWVLLFCLIGVYCAGANVFDICIMVIFGVLGYGLQKLGYEPAPLVMAERLMSDFEKNFNDAGPRKDCVE